jgi:hypothetical protein
MKFPSWLPVWGVVKWRGDCPQEYVEQASFFSKLRREWPDTWGVIALHPRNEGLLQKGQFSAVIKHSAEGMAKGASDIVIPARVSFVCEVKRVDHTKSHWQEGQLKYLEAAQGAGAYACAALGAIAAWEAFNHWLATYQNP